VFFLHVVFGGKPSPQEGHPLFGSGFQFSFGHDPEAIELPERNVNVVPDFPFAFVVFICFLIVLLIRFDLSEAVNLTLLKTLAPAVIMWN
jgi:hypothetical protein